MLKALDVWTPPQGRAEQRLPKPPSSQKDATGLRTLDPLFLHTEPTIPGSWLEALCTPTIPEQQSWEPPSWP